MYTTQPICRLCFYILVVLAAVAYYVITADRFIFWLVIPACIWLRMYLLGLRIYSDKKYFIRSTGRITNRRIVIKKANVTAVSTLTLLPFLPGLLKIYFANGDVTIFGLNGRQIKLIASQF